jgi:hypothetical protein
MKASELITILETHPEWDVEIESPTQIASIATVDTDCFETEQGFVFVIEGDWDKED